MNYPLKQKMGLPTTWRRQTFGASFIQSQAPRPGTHISRSTRPDFPLSWRCYILDSLLHSFAGTHSLLPDNVWPDAKRSLSRTYQPSWFLQNTVCVCLCVCAVAVLAQITPWGSHTSSAPSVPPNYDPKVYNCFLWFTLLFKQIRN